MHDINLIRNNPEFFDQCWSKLGISPQTPQLLQIDRDYRENIHIKETLLAERNALSKKIIQQKRQGKNIDVLIAKVQQIKTQITKYEKQHLLLSTKLHNILSTLPNLPHESVPYGKESLDNHLVRSWGEIRNFNFVPKQHFVLGEALGMMDFSLASRLVGSRFVTLSHDLAMLERALVSFMLNMHITQHGLIEISLPVLVNKKTMYNTGQLPKFAEDLYHTSDDYWLIPTAEVPLTNIGANRIFSINELPLRFTAYTQCFRREAGAAGQDTRGMLRQHQFSKVEMVTLCVSDYSFDELERMIKCAENILKALVIPYRVMLLCSGDMSPTANKTYDLEVWLPGQKAYREVSSCSNCGSYQALRMKSRVKTTKGNVPIHSLNGSGLAVGRTFIAVMENYQQENGSIIIPEVLQPWMGGKTIITI